jgi:hypothetical protein
LRGCGNVEFGPDTADKRRRTAVGRKHAAQKEQVAGLNGFRVRPERRWRRWQRDSEVSQPLLSPRPDAGAHAISSRASHQTRDPGSIGRRYRPHLGMVRPAPIPRSDGRRAPPASILPQCHRSSTSSASVVA